MTTLEQLDTPALIVDLDRMEDNLRRMQSFVNDNGLTLRPHTKAHKIPALANLQIAQGAQGICVAKLGEAEVMLAGGIKDVLITTPIANEIKIKRLAGLVKQYPDARILQVIDHPYHAKSISEAAAATNVSIDVLIEVESGQQRCGVNAGPDLLALIETVNALPNISYQGIQAYSGHLQHITDFHERETLARSAVKPVFDYIDQVLTTPALKPVIISGGGSGTYNMYEGLPFTELQAGSYLFMDWDYRTIGSGSGSDHYHDFECALKVWTTVISHPTNDRAVVDAGMKCLSIDSGMPKVEGRDDIDYLTGGDEHGILRLSESSASIAIGDQLTIIPSHCDTTLNQFSTLYGIRKGMVEKQWSIEGRGRSD